MEQNSGADSQQQPYSGISSQATYSPVKRSHEAANVGSASSSKTDLQTDAELLELLSVMDSVSPIIPEALTDYYLGKAGIECDDVRLKRLLAIITQKFVSDIAQDAVQYSTLRQGVGRKPGGAANATSSAAIGSSGAAGTLGASAAGGAKKLTLTMEDLAAACSDYGINIKRPPYHL